MKDATRVLHGVRGFRAHGSGGRALDDNRHPGFRIYVPSVELRLWSLQLCSLALMGAPLLQGDRTLVDFLRPVSISFPWAVLVRLASQNSCKG